MAERDSGSHPGGLLSREGRHAIEFRRTPYDPCVPSKIWRSTVAPALRVVQSRQWPLIADIDAVETDNAKVVIERADALIKAQDDGLKAMEARMSSLFGQSVTLASAAVAATTTAFAALGAQSGGQLPPPWAQEWVARALAVLSAFWLAAVAIAAASMLSQTWTASGMQPWDLYSEGVLTAPANSVRLVIARALQDAIDRNAVRVARYVRRLAWVVGLLATGPLMTAAIALLLARPRWTPFALALAILATNIWLVWFLYRRATSHSLSLATTPISGESN